MKRLFICGFLFLYINFSYAGEWGVSPIRIELLKSNPTSSVTVTNDGKTALNFIIKEMEWQQDEQGNDKYKESQDLVFFPKSFKLEGQSSRVIRIGFKNPPSGREKAYRLFIEELPPEKLEGRTFVAIAVRFGVPIFIKPDIINISGAIEKVELDKNKITIGFRNTGNSYIKIESINVYLQDENSNSFKTLQVSGWYVFPGVFRRFSTDITKEDCEKVKKIALSVISENREFKETVDAGSKTCE